MRRPIQVIGGTILALAAGLMVTFAAEGALRAQNPDGVEWAPVGAEGEEAELQRGAYTEDDYQLDAFSPEVAEIQARQSELRQRMIERLIDILESDPYHPDKAELFFRIAEAHWEEARYRYLRDRVAFDQAYVEYDAGRLSELPPEPGPEYGESLKYYRKIVAQFPEYVRIDEVYYYLGQGALSAGERRQDRALQREGVTYFQRLVQDHPDSRFIADAHLRLGEYYFENMSLYYAKVNYEKIIQNHMDSPMYNYALYKLGWVYFNLREFDQAIETFQAVVAEIDADADVVGRVEFRAQALNDLIVTYAEIEDGWRHARDYFIEVVGEEEAYDRLRRLADLYVAQDRDDYAIQLYNHLVDYEPNSERIPFYMEQLIEVRKRLNLWEETEQEMRRMIAYFDPEGPWWAANEDNPEILEEAHTQAETTLLFIANYYHREAQEHGREADYAQAARDYEYFLKRFPESEMGYVVNFYFAEILFDNLKDYERAAEQYGQVIERDPRGEYVEDAALGVIYAYEELLVREGLREAARGGRQLERTRLTAEEVRERRKPIEERELHPLHEKFIAAADHYVELMTSLLKDPEVREEEPDRGSDIPRIMFIASQVFYEHGMFEDAVSRLRTLFEYDPSHEFAGYAVNTLLDAYVRLRHWDRVEEWARRLIEANNFIVKSRRELDMIIATAINEQARDYVTERRTSDAEREMKRLLREFRRKDPDLAARVMFNLAAVYERSHNLRDAIRTYQGVTREFPDSEMAPEAQFTIGLIYEGQTQFVEAATAFEAFQQRQFRDYERAPEALLNAALLREAIEQYDEAISVYQAYVSLFADREGIDNIADVYFRIGVAHESKGTAAGLKAAHDHYLRFIQRYPRNLPRVVEAYSRAGLALKKIDKTANRRAATRLFEQAAQAFGRMSSEEKAGPARHHAARALFEIAEYVFDDYREVRILATDPRELRRVLTRKAELFASANELYERVYDLRSSGVTAGAMFRQGLLNYDFAENLLNAPIPEDLPEELQGEYVMALEGHAGPVQEMSLIAFQAAMQFAREQGVYNEWSRQSAQYAARVNPDEFPISEEPYVRPDRPNDTLAAQAFIRSLRRGDVEVQILKWERQRVPATEAGGSETSTIDDFE